MPYEAVPFAVAVACCIIVPDVARTDLSWGVRCHYANQTPEQLISCRPKVDWRNTIIQRRTSRGSSDWLKGERKLICVGLTEKDNEKVITRA